MCALHAARRVSLDELEWLVENLDDIVVVGLMVREFGSNAEAATHGQLVRQVCAGSQGPEKV